MVSSTEPLTPNSTAASATEPADKSTAQLVTDLTRLVPELAREEIALAKAELAEKGKHAGVGAGLFGAAGITALFGVGVLLAAAVAGLAEVLPVWASALIVAAVLLVVAGVLALVGKKQVSQATPPAPTQAVASTKRDVQAVKESAKR
jgi:peptidoglycan/LPS O-acetylase OafA/YrhL